MTKTRANFTSPLYIYLYPWRSHASSSSTSSKAKLKIPSPRSCSSCCFFLSLFRSNHPRNSLIKPEQQAKGNMEMPQGHEAAALRSAAQNKPPATAARPWPRGGGASSSAATPPPPPKVYRVEPREFRDLVQRLTGAPPTALRRQNHQQQHHHQHPHRVVGVAAPVVQPQPVRAGGGQQQSAYGAVAQPWFSFPMAGAVEAAQPQHGAFL